MLPFLLVLLLSLSSSALTSDIDYFIACGLPKSTTHSSEDGTKTWRSDDNPAFTPPDINKISSSVIGQGADDPYTRARIFESAVTYSFAVSPGPNFIRLYFTTTASYNYNTTTTISASQFFVSVEANGFTLLDNFSVFLNNQNSTKSNEVMYEFHVSVENGKPLNLTFSPPTNCTSTNTCYAFVNGIEIIAVPEGLYFNATRFPPPSFISTVEYSLQQTAFQTVHRINVGGITVGSEADSGELGRIWKADETFIANNFYGTTIYNPTIEGNLSAVEYTLVPRYVAPPQVYVTLRYMGLDYPESLRRNLTWNFEVDPGFDYLVRLHFCELDIRVFASYQRQFEVYINNEYGGLVDVWGISGGWGIAVFQDYVVRLFGQSNGTKVPLLIALHPHNAKLQKVSMNDVLLNGVEILKLNQSNGSLAVPNQPLKVAPTPSSTPNTSPKHHALPIIVGAIGGTLILTSLVIIACLIVYKKKADTEALRKKSMTTSTSTKDKWIQPPSYSSSTPSTRNSSLPSDLCRRFSLAQIRVATCDFDEKLIVGRGGFGTVYMGSIEGENTTVAIKRLNSTSKQGTHEFQTEIEMLSRLRHVHLVSLIGYCEDQGEMILVYEYMSRGTLRDHLMYKNTSKNDQTNNISLSWKERLKICVGSARGLHYLHAGAKQVIIHRDVKSTNILLDDKWTAKVSDFGLSKVGPDPDGAGITHISTAVKGSVGYLDPEYYQRRQLTEKSDVYSFGVVLFEVLCARAVVKPNLPREQANLANWATTRYKSGTLNTIVDPNLAGQIAPECLRKFGEIASMCVRDRGSERPPMGDIVWGLEFALQLQEAAEKNNTNGADFEDFSIPTSIDLNERILYNYDSYASGDDLSKSSNVVDSNESRLLDSKSSANNSSDYPIDKSASVFSEIMDPKAR